MSDATNRPAAEIAEERLELAAKAQNLRNEVLSLDGDERIAKGLELQETVERLETVDREYTLADSLENAEKMIKKLSQQPRRVTPVSYAGTVKYDSRSGQITDSIGNVGFGESQYDEARMSYEYTKAFNELVRNRFDISRVRSSEQREILERYGKGEGFQGDEFFIPFRKDMTLGTTTNGSNAVPPDFRQDIITQRTITPVMASLVQTINTTRTKVTYPRNADASATDQVGTSFASTKAEKPNTTLSQKDTGPFTQLTIDINTGTMWTAVTLDFLDDVPNAQAYIVNEGLKAFAAAYDNETINGATASGQCEGVLNCASVGVTKTGTNNTLVATKITEAWYAFRSQYATNLGCVMQRPTHGKLINLLDANNRSLFLPHETGMMINGRPSIMSIPIYYNEYVPASGVSTPKSIIVGDWNEYILAIRSGISVTVDVTSGARFNLAYITWRFRFGGAVRDPRAFRIVHELA